MFTKGFQKYACVGHTITCVVDGFEIRAQIEDDPDTGPPWKEHDGHGPVTDWVSRGKNAGERVLNEDRGSFRYYDFAQAVVIAKRDGWGPVIEGETDGQRAERCATADFEAMRAWCKDEWFWCGIVVTVSRDDLELGDASLWGIDCNHPEGDSAYLMEIANDLLPEAMEKAKARLEKLCSCA